ncbi:MAG: hypothetical protein H0U46_05660, partial [Actinobacteria bacterium]|nr:hypothetical protein [Actinomycetota bacterium]
MKTDEGCPSAVEPVAAFHVEPPRRAPGLFDARPANDTTLTVVTLPPYSADSPRATEPPRSAQVPVVAAVRTVGPVRTDFRPSLRTPAVRRAAVDPRRHPVVTPTCALCGERDALVTADWEGREVPACVRCWRKERTAVPTPRPAQISLEQNAYALDRRILAALRAAGSATIVQICQALGLLGEGERGSRHGDQRSAYESVRDGVYRLEAAGRVKRQPRGRRVRFE